MFFRKWIFNDNSKRKAFARTELNKCILKFLLSNYAFKDVHRVYFSKLLTTYGKQTSISSLRSFCKLSGYPKSVFRFFRLSRHVCKKHASNGLLVGMRKSSF